MLSVARVSHSVGDMQASEAFSSRGDVFYVWMKVWRVSHGVKLIL